MKWAGFSLSIFGVCAGLAATATGEDNGVFVVTAPGDLFISSFNATCAECPVDLS